MDETQNIKAVVSDNEETFDFICGRLPRSFGEQLTRLAVRRFGNNTINGCVNRACADTKLALSTYRLGWHLGLVVYPAYFEVQTIGQRHLVESVADNGPAVRCFTISG